MRRRAAVWALALLAGSGCGAERAPAPPEGRERNVLLLSVDTWRGDHLRSTRGGVALTPRLDAFTASATTFANASSASNATSAGVTGLITGLLPVRAGVVRNADRLQDEVPTLAGVLRAQGFGTAAFVANPILASEHGFARGFDRYALLSRTRRQTTGHAAALTGAALAWLESREPGVPFLLWLHYMDPHGPYEPPPSTEALFSPDAFERLPPVALLPAGDQSGRGGVPYYQQTTPDGSPASRDPREYQARYAAEVRSVDDALGDLLDVMERRGWLEDTIVVLTSDHGEALAGEHGYWFSHGHGLTRDQIHVPLVLRCRVCEAGATVTRPVSTVDVVPTLLGLLAVPAPVALDGHDLLEQRPRLVVSQDPDETSVRDGSWKLLLRRGGEPQLVDLAEDPEETGDVAAREPERVRRMQRALLASTRPPLVLPVARQRLGPEELEGLRVLGYAE